MADNGRKPPDKHVKNRALAQGFIDKQFKPGQSGNPNGRPKKELPSETLAMMADAIYDRDDVKRLQQQMPEPWRSKPQLTIQEIQCWLHHIGALKANGAMDRERVFDRLEGRPTQKIAGPDGGPIQVTAFNLKRLSTEEIRRLRELEAKAREEQE